ncbi:Diphthine--ammonia ligase [Ceratocystis fimbriata CBS 114723]|uniref:Diphthine--ammonia ligase n=1 Tax=Ceratocystis fimbriata CBS 114723 TaxID=1035309 RepID=A0A2C5XH27_9PEZI|nr:Diphthine--ammonia ligase [Ceratocystis fimbriata CBS 114723]
MSGLNVIALVSGGKDSFYAALHAQHNGHRLVALANLYPGTSVSEPTPESTQGSVSEPHRMASNGVIVYSPQEANSPDFVHYDDAEEQDPNSFMYQTVGHQILPLYAQALNLPLYRRALAGTGAVQNGCDYETSRADDSDETESMVPLLREIMERHPEANAISAGAILSTYQRTRVESVAIRLGLVPLAYLWKFPVLPSPNNDGAQLLRDMEAAGMDARIIKVASAGLDDDFLWTKVSSAQGVARLQKTMRRFGSGPGAVIGEGGEFETLVVDGPASLFRKRILVPDSARTVISEGGGTSYLEFKDASLEDKPAGSSDEMPFVRTPDLLEPEFTEILQTVRDKSIRVAHMREEDLHSFSAKQLPQRAGIEWFWTYLPDAASRGCGIEEETRSCMAQIQEALVKSSEHMPSLNPASDVTQTMILLRSMDDFATVNPVYAELFQFANPPTRVTVAVGDMLPENCSIAICVTAFPGVSSLARHGLHVQSRSYWAPANIGPYSQAIDHGVYIETAEGNDLLSIRVVAVAGQIPLIPATMSLPENEPDAGLQIVLSLQHLWRIAREMKVQMFTGTVAMFPRAESEDAMRSNVLMASKAWEGVFPTPPVDGGDDDESPDIDVWDQRNNPEYAAYGQQESQVALPDWELFMDGTEFTNRRVPFFYGIEVETLPRNAACEWKIQFGLACLEPMCLSSGYHTSQIGGKWKCEVRHMRLKEGPMQFILSSVSIAGPAEEGMEISHIAHEAWCESLAQDNKTAKEVMFELYVDVVQLGKSAFQEGWSMCVPCRSVWSSTGEKLLAVALFNMGELV